MSFRISLPGNRRTASRFVSSVRRRLLKALAENPDKKQTQIAKDLGVHRSVITRQLKGTSDMSLARVAEIAWALGYKPVFDLQRPAANAGSNRAETRTDAIGKTPAPGPGTDTGIPAGGEVTIHEFAL